MDISQLKQLADLKYLRSESALATLRTQESTIRTELMRLRTLEQETHNQAVADVELRAVGGDIIWLKWLASSRRKLNIELAQVLAQKERFLAQHKRATGEKTVAAELNSQIKRTAQKAKEQKALQQAINASLLQKSINSPGGQSR